MRFTPRTLLNCAMVAFVLANVGRIPSGPLGGRVSALTLNDLMLFPLWGMLGAVWLRRTGAVRVERTTLWTLGFVGVATLSTVLAIDRYSLGVGAAIGVSAFLVRWVLYAGWYFVPRLEEREDNVRDSWRIVDRAILCIAAFGIFQSMFLPGFAQLLHVGGENATDWDRQGRRLVSTLLDPNFAGILIVMALLPRLARLIDGLVSSRRVLAMLGVALLLTLSRSSILALLMGVGVLLLVRGFSLRMLRVALVSALFMLPLITVIADFAADYNKLRIDGSALARLIPWVRAIRLLQAHPFFGVGFNAIEPAQRQMGWHAVAGTEVSLDGGLLFLAAMTGLVGLAAYSGILANVLSSARRTWRSAAANPEERAFATGTAAVTIALLVHSFFSNSLLLPFVMEVSWLRWGASAAVARRVIARAALAKSP